MTVCEVLGHRAPRGWGGPPYGRARNGRADGTGRQHWEVWLECTRCGQDFHLCSFHGPLPSTSRSAPKRKPRNNPDGMPEMIGDGMPTMKGRP